MRPDFRIKRGDSSRSYEMWSTMFHDELFSMLLNGCGSLANCYLHSLVSAVILICTDRLNARSEGLIVAWNLVLAT